MGLGGAGDAEVGKGEGASSANQANGKSWAAIVDGDSLAQGLNMPPLEKKEVEGKRRLVITQQSYAVLCQPFRFSAIATLAGGAGRGRLDYSFIFASLRSQWSGIKDLRFTSVGKGMFLVRTSSNDDLQLLLSPGKWYVGGRLLIANQWHPVPKLSPPEIVSRRVPFWLRYGYEP
ncbi:hypothetical protein EJ110_NYTH30857 [Nymphaea thermarum]|nr:hypothetical protein EJ110_NYTH30857 [Nymphaea thermarum]